MLELLPMAFASAVYPTLLAVVILILTSPTPERTEALIKRVHEWLGSHTRQIAIGTAASPPPI